MMKYAVYNHQNKAAKYIQALDTVYERVELPENGSGYYPRVDFVFTDNDVRGRSQHLNRLRIHGARCTFKYPHTARPNLVNDIRTPWRFTTCSFVTTPGHKEIMEMYGYPHPIHPVGWTLCPLRAFQPRSEPRKVLFAPIHPRCAKIDQQLNRDVFNKLYKLVQDNKIELTVRYIGELEDGGLARVNHRRIRYTPGRFEPAYGQIDRADVVVSHQTFAYMAVARGVPTVMMAEYMPTHLVPLNSSHLDAINWNQYKHLVMYPLDIMTTRDPLSLLYQAVESDRAIAEWRERMIGKPFDAEYFLELVQSYLEFPTRVRRTDGSGEGIVKKFGLFTVMDRKEYLRQKRENFSVSERKEWLKKHGKNAKHLSGKTS